LGQASIKTGRDQKAEDYFRNALKLVEPLVSTQPADLDALYAAADAYSGLGELAKRRAQHAGSSAKRGKSDWSDAKSWYQQSLNTWHRIEHPNHTAPSSFQVGDPVTVGADLKLAEAALALAH